MSENFSVAVSYGENLGYVEFDETTKKVIVEIGDEVAKRKTEEFLSRVHEIKIPHETLLDFTTEKINPQADAESLKIVLTRLWENTGVHVDWSRPVEYVKLHPHY